MESWALPVMLDREFYLGTENKRALEETDPCQRSIRVTLRSVAIFGFALWTQTVLGANRGKAEKANLPKTDLFDAIEQGDLEVRLIPKNAKQATVVMRNKGDVPLKIQMPDAFVGMPVLAQDGGFRRMAAAEEVEIKPSAVEWEEWVAEWE